jgi:hypothetical protein
MARFMLVKFSLMAEITDADALREAALKKFRRRRQHVG